MTPAWTILIATLGQRQKRFVKLLDVLLPQLGRHDGAVTVCALWNNGERPLGEVRQDLIEHATSSYVSFVDDDDEVPEYFVDEVVACLVTEPDYVGWQMQCYVDGVPQKPTYHSLRYRRWYDDRKGYYRDVSHLNPIRTSIARLADFRRGAPPEDVSWTSQVRPFVHTEAYIDKIMYHYRSSPSDSTWRPGSVPREQHERPDVHHSYFSYHPASSS